MSQQKALPWREGVKTATQGKPEDHDRCSLACVGGFSSLAQPVFLSEGVSGSGVRSDIMFGVSLANWPCLWFCFSVVDVFLLSLFFVFLWLLLPFAFFSARWCRVLMNPSLRPSRVDGLQPDVCLRKWTKQHSTTAHTIQTQPKEASTDLYITLCYKQKYLIKKLFIVVAFYVMHILPIWYIYVL